MELHLDKRPTYRIERTLRVMHSLNYRYTEPVSNVATRLRLLPHDVRGEQRLLDSRYHLAPLPDSAAHQPDPFGNDLLEVRYGQIWEHLTFVIELEIVNAATYAADGHVLPTPIPVDAGASEGGIEAYLNPTPLSRPNADLEAIANETLRGLPEDGDRESAAARAFALCRRVFAEMRYETRVTTVKTTAAEAWDGKRGVCQDYTHVFLALCRLAGMPARYVSGFLPGEGAMHAWAEVLLPAGESGAGWVALDPTHDRWVNERYVTVAVGRDYSDITPSSGTFTGSARNELSHRSRVQVERTTHVPL